MKNLKIYILGFLLAFVSFAVHSSTVKAEEQTEGETEVQTVVINANASGKPTNVYEVSVPSEVEGEEPTIESKQFVKSRDITVNIYIDEATKASYSNIFSVCEVIKEGTNNNTREEEKCSEYDLGESSHKFQLSTPEDGEKKVNVYFYANYATKDVALKETRKITLDTTGPKITLTDGNYIYIPSGKTYSEPGSSCVDDSGVQLSEGCVVVVEEKTIDINKAGFQYIRYSAVDFLGNETNVLRKIVVEQLKADEGVDSYWLYAGGALVIVILALGYVVIKNKEKQKNQSVL